jgi:hypothetical protein
MQAYSDPRRESDPHALPDLEIYEYHAEVDPEGEDCPQSYDFYDHEHSLDCSGWYWVSCFPGCLPDSDPTGPFANCEEALADARQGLDQECDCSCHDLSAPAGCGNCDCKREVK